MIRAARLVCTVRVVWVAGGLYGQGGLYSQSLARVGRRGGAGAMAETSREHGARSKEQGVGSNWRALESGSWTCRLRAQACGGTRAQAWRQEQEQEQMQEQEQGQGRLWVDHSALSTCTCECIGRAPTSPARCCRGCRLTSFHG